MKYWIVPSNDHIFRIGDAMQAQGELVDWRQSNNFSVGDIVFIYKTKPEQRIRYRMEIKSVGISLDDAFNQEPYWTDKDTYYSGLGSFRYARFRLLEEYDDDIMSLQHLREHGLLGTIQGVMQCKNEDLLEFLLHPNETTNTNLFDVDYPEDNDKLYEGALVKVLANKYERNQKARKECVEKKGYKCLVCGRDFEATYGKIGKGFIHVHHLIPISSIGKEYQLDVEKHLVPVCPNCHYMLHRRNPPYTIEELQMMLREQNTTTTPEKKRQRVKTEEIRLIAKGTIISDVNDDDELRRLIHNMMEMDGGTMMMNINSVCIKQFGERYGSMQPKDWEHLIYGYIRKVTSRPDLKEDTLFYFKVV